jgi:hypothetical protein
MSGEKKAPGIKRFYYNQSGAPGRSAILRDLYMILQFGARHA